VYGILFALSLVSSFFIPAQSVTVRTIVPREGWLSANALMQQNMQITRILSPALAGAAVALAGPNLCFWIDAASFLFSAWMLSGIVVRRDAAPATAGVRGVLAEMVVGLRFLFTHAAISFVMAATGAAVFTMGCFGPLIAIHVRDWLHAGPATFGVLSALVGVGMIAGTQSIHRFGRHRSPEHMVLAGLATIGAGVFLMAAVRLVAFTALGTLGMGIGTGFIIAPAQTLFQRETPIQLAGRISSSVMAVISVSQILGLLVSGNLAQAAGIRNLFFLSAAGLVAMAAAGHIVLARRATLRG
jgi:MFS family permease